MTSKGDRGGSLTPEQTAVVELVGQGWTDQRIARELDVSVSTVRRRLRAAADRLGVHSRAAIAVAANRVGALSKTNSQDAGEQKRS